MPIIAKEGREFHLIPTGNHQAVCYDVWDIGYQKGEYKGIPTATHKIIIAWEVDERIKSNDEYNGKRYAINGWYTLSLGKKSNLRRDLTSWRGKEFTSEELNAFDIEKLIAANCFLNIIHKEEDKAQVSAVTSLPKNMAKLEPENKRSIPDWVKKFQAKALTEEEARAIWAEAEAMKDKGEAHSNGDGDENIPF